MILAGEEIGAVARSRRAGVPGGVEGATAHMPAAAASCFECRKRWFGEMRLDNRPWENRVSVFGWCVAAACRQVCLGANGRFEVMQLMK